jgi:glycosyltransferase involved in cell wall biosynthesis
MTKVELLPQKSDGAATRARPERSVSISAVIITLNAAATVERTVASLDWCDEIVVVDSGSTDGTTEICLRHGCKVISHPFAGFGPQKHFAVSQAAHDWVFVVDADEVASPELRKEIESEFRGDRPLANGYRVRIPLVFLGRPLRHGGEVNKTHLRLFDRRKGNFNDALVHEAVEMQDAVRELAGALDHYSYYNLDHYFAKFNDYTTRAAQQLDDQGVRAHPLTAALRLPFTFLHMYFVRGLFLDGFRGFVWAALCAYYRLVKHAKLWELQVAKANLSAKQTG